MDVIEIISYINLGISGIFIGLMIITFIPSNLIDINLYDSTVHSFSMFFETFKNNLNLKGNGVYIPPYTNLPKGGLFISSDKYCNIHLGNFDEETFKINYGNESGVLIAPPLNYSFIKEIEKYSNMDFSNSDIYTTISAVSSTLKAYGLIDTIEYEEIDNNIIKLTIEDIKLKSCLNLDVKTSGIICPIISSTLHIIAKSLNQLMTIKEIEKKGNCVEITIVKLGTIDEHMW